LADVDDREKNGSAPVKNMLTYYCPNCWEMVAAEDEKCPKCGFFLKNFDETDYEEKLIAALHHPVSERRIMAAEVLGNRGSRRALPEFKKILSSGEMNYYILRSVLMAIMKIEDPEREKLLRQALVHPSDLAAGLAKELLDKLSSKANMDQWDRQTG
jgi:HEAT repeat protein